MYIYVIGSQKFPRLSLTSLKKENLIHLHGNDYLESFWSYCIYLVKLDIKKNPRF